MKFITAGISDYQAVMERLVEMDIGIDQRFKTRGMRPDSWWFSLADWYIPPADRILRDRIRTPP